MNTRILLVEDEPDIVAVMKLTLELKGYYVITAYDGEEGLEKAKENHPDLIILDVLMPKVSGDDLANKLKNDPDTASIPIIFLTNLPPNFLTDSEESGIDLQRDRRGNAYLHKTCSEEELFSAITQALSK